MLLLIFSQEDRDERIGLFENMKEGRDFLQQIPGYKFVQEEVEGIPYSYETLDPGLLPDYMEIQVKGNRLPLSRFMFSSQEPVDVFWQELPNLSKENQGMVPGSMRVDAYLLHHHEVKDYIEKREAVFQRLAKELEEQGYGVGRNYAGSEDGEALVYSRQEEEGEHLLCYMDPAFVDLFDLQEEELRAWLRDELAATSS